MSQPNDSGAPSHAERMSTVRGVTLLDDEELLFDVRPAWYGKMTLKRLAWWIIATVCTAGFALLYFWYPAVKMWRSSKKIRYVITSERIVEKDVGGMFGTEHTSEIPIRDITDVETRATWFEQRAHVGTVSFKEHDGASSTVSLTSVRDYEEIASTISGYQRREKEKYRQPHYGER